MERIAKSVADGETRNLVSVDGKGDEGGEPEEHGEGVEGEDGEDVGDGGEEFGGEADIEDDEAGPDAGEEHEVVLGGGEAVGCDCERGLAGGGPVGLEVACRGEGMGVPWPVRPMTMIAKMNWMARMARMARSRTPIFGSVDWVRIEVRWEV